jgi:hypothetical protein
VLLFELLPAMTPFIGIPLCVAAFGAAALLTGAVRRSDVETLLGTLKKKPPQPAEVQARADQ